MSDYINIPTVVLRDLAQQLLDAANATLLAGVESDRFVEIPVSIVEGARQYFIDGDSDDHSVGLCTCDTNYLAQELTLTLAGEMTCDMCAGDGMQWDQDKAKAFVEANPGVSDCFAGYVDCGKCFGTGKLNVSEFC